MNPNAQGALTGAAEQTSQPREHYHAEIPVEGAAVRIHAPSLLVLTLLINRLHAKQIDPAVQAAYEEASARVTRNEAGGVSAVEKQAVVAAADAVQKAAGKPDPKPEKSKAQTEGNAPSTSATQSEVQQSAGPADKPSSASTSAAASVTYDDVKKVVNALFAIKPDHAVTALKDFGVTHATKLTAEQWPEFVAASQKRLAELKVAA